MIVIQQGKSRLSGLAPNQLSKEWYFLFHLLPLQPNLKTAGSILSQLLLLGQKVQEVT